MLKEAEKEKKKKMKKVTLVVKEFNANNND